MHQPAVRCACLPHQNLLSVRCWDVYSSGALGWRTRPPLFTRRSTPRALCCVVVTLSTQPCGVRGDSGNHRAGGACAASRTRDRHPLGAQGHLETFWHPGAARLRALATPNRGISARHLSVCCLMSAAAINQLVWSLPLAAWGPSRWQPLPPCTQEDPRPRAFCILTPSASCRSPVRLMYGNAASRVP